jgi:hypothetical protein
MDFKKSISKFIYKYLSCFGFTLFGFYFNYLDGEYHIVFLSFEGFLNDKNKSLFELLIRTDCFIKVQVLFLTFYIYDKENQ